MLTGLNTLNDFGSVRIRRASLLATYSMNVKVEQIRSVVVAPGHVSYSGHTADVAIRGCRRLDVIAAYTKVMSEGYGIYGHWREA